MNNIVLERGQARDINDSLVQVDETFDVKALPDSILTVCAVLRLRVDEGADGSDVVRRLEPAVAVSRGDGRFIDVGGQEEDDDVETGLEGVFLHVNTNSPVRTVSGSSYYVVSRVRLPVLHAGTFSVS